MRPGCCHCHWGGVARGDTHRDTAPGGSGGVPKDGSAHRLQLSHQGAQRRWGGTGGTVRDGGHRGGGGGRGDTAGGGNDKGGTRCTSAVGRACAVPVGSDLRGTVGHTGTLCPPLCPQRPRVPIPAIPKDSCVPPLCPQDPHVLKDRVPKDPHLPPCPLPCARRPPCPPCVPKDLCPLCPPP